MRKWLHYAAAAVVLTLLSSALPVRAETPIQPPAPSIIELSGPPIIRPDLARKIAPGITIIPGGHINGIPNIGIIEGRHSVLVVDTGLGPGNGLMAYELAKKLAGNRKLYVTTTHFHPEHNFGLQAFEGHATIILNKAQADELAEKGQAYLELFRKLSPDWAKALQDVRLVAPSETYIGRKVLDLGGRQVVLEEMPAHTRGDQIIFVTDSKTIFLGDLVEQGFFPVTPDADASGQKWLGVLKRVEALSPKIVVPGHGDVGDISLVHTCQTFFEQVQSDVRAGIEAGKNQDTLSIKIRAKMKKLHPDWQNSLLIPLTVANFYSSLTGKPIQLPPLETLNQ